MVLGGFHIQKRAIRVARHTVSIYSPDVASSPASNGVNLAPIFASTAFTSYQPAINAAFKAMIIELGLFNPAILDGLTLLQDTPLPTVSLSTNQVAACTACALSLVGQSLEFEAVITNILGEEVPFEEINLGPETETPLQSGNEAFDEALSRAIWGNQPPPLPPH